MGYASLLSDLLNKLKIGRVETNISSSNFLYTGVIE